MINPCNCKAEHWQPHAESCPLATRNKRSVVTEENDYAGRLRGWIGHPACPSQSVQDDLRAGADAITQLRGNLSLAEEGLASYALEVQRLQKDRNECLEAFHIPISHLPGAQMIAAALRSAIEKIPTREERLGGQTFKYVKLSEVLDLLDTFHNTHEPLPCASLPTSNPDCPKCHGAGWVYGTQLENPSFDTQMDTMTHYTCDSAECNPEQSQGASRDASSEKAVK